MSNYPGDRSDLDSIMPERAIAWEREESGEPCQKGTPGCAIDHGRDAGDCEGW